MQVEVLRSRVEAGQGWERHDADGEIRVGFPSASQSGGFKKGCWRTVKTVKHHLCGELGDVKMGCWQDPLESQCTAHPPAQSQSAKKAAWQGGWGMRAHAARRRRQLAGVCHGVCGVHLN